MVEQDAVAGIDAVGFAVIDGDPVGVELGYRIGTARIKRGGFLLRSLLHQPVQFGSGCLIKAGLLLKAKDADRFQDAQGTEAVGVGGVFRRFKRNGHMAHRGEVIDLVWLHLLDDTNQVGGVGQVSVMQFEFGIINVRVLIQMVDSIRIKQRSAPFDAVNHVTLLQQEFSQDKRRPGQ